jgi:hypothetical protein
MLLTSNFNENLNLDDLDFCIKETKFIEKKLIQ